MNSLEPWLVRLAAFQGDMQLTSKSRNQSYLQFLVCFNLASSPPEVLTFKLLSNGATPNLYRSKTFILLRLFIEPTVEQQPWKHHKHFTALTALTVLQHTVSTKPDHCTNKHRIPVQRCQKKLWDPLPDSYILQHPELDVWSPNHHPAAYVPASPCWPPLQSLSEDTGMMLMQE